MNTKKNQFISVSTFSGTVLSVKIYKCDFDSLGVIYLTCYLLTTCCRQTEKFGKL